MKTRLLVILALALALTVSVAACGGDEPAAEPAPAGEPPAEEPAGEPPAEEPSAEEPPAEEPPAEEPPAEAGQKGGTLRVDWEAAFNFTGSFDPTGEYLGEAWGIYSNLLVRTLLAPNHIAGPEGNTVHPDLAVDMPEVSDDGLTYTFTLKDGIKFGPPLSREITSADVAYAFQRLAGVFGESGYPGYYQVIEGFSEFGDGNADTITGIETPDDKTIVFTLTQPTGDFTFRLAMPATGPIPEEVASCFTEPGEYGRYVISSGPYMIEGSDQLDATSCDTLEPLAGFDPASLLHLVRNPDYDPATDTPEMRENNPDEFVFTINSNNDDIYDRTRAGEIDLQVASETPKVLREYSESEDLKDNLKNNQGDRTWYISMVLNLPPFDDIHVRKAANLVMDKVGLVLAWGGPISGDLATHIVPNSLLPGLEDYDPYATPEHRGDVEAAKAEMAQSKYDTDKDGICDAPECKDVLHVTGTTATRKAMVPVMEDSLGKIGITLKTRLVDDVYSVILTPERNSPISGQPGWGKDYADPFTYFFYLFYGPNIQAQGNYVEELTGLTPEKAEEVGVTYPEGGVPSIDADFEACTALAAEERNACWADLDKKVMEEVVPWIPYLWSNATSVTADSVTKYDFDQFTTTPAWSKIAIDPSKQN